MELCFNEMTVMKNGALPEDIALCAQAGFSAVELRKGTLLRYLRGGGTLEALWQTLEEQHVRAASLNALESVSFQTKAGGRMLRELSEWCFAACRVLGCGCMEVIASFNVPEGISTAAICREYAAKYPDRIRLVTSPENVGWRANYRRTFEACRGKYVAYLDGDDWWCDLRKLQMQADLMESDPGCGMCYTRASNYWQASDRTEPDHPDHYTDFGRLLCSLTIANCATLARRELIARY